MKTANKKIMSLSRPSHKTGYPAVRLQNIVKKYNNHTAVDTVSFDVNHGETLALFGPSGCGKTTTLRLIAGFLSPDWGKIWLHDHLMSSPERVVAPYKRKIGMVFQNLALWPHMTVKQHISFAIDKKKYRRKSRNKKIIEIMDLVQLTQKDSYPHQLSGGEQQRLAIARALAAEPDILLFDEPLSNLDIKLKQQLLAELKDQIRRLGITVLYVTHQPEEAIYLADRVAVMANGSIASFYTASEFIQYQQEIWTTNDQCSIKTKKRDNLVKLASCLNTGS